MLRSRSALSELLWREERRNVSQSRSALNRHPRCAAAAGDGIAGSAREGRPRGGHVHGDGDLTDRPASLPRGCPAYLQGVCRTSSLHVAAAQVQAPDLIVISLRSAGFSECGSACRTQVLRESLDVRSAWWDAGVRARHSVRRRAVRAKTASIRSSRSVPCEAWTHSLDLISPRRRR